LGRLLCKGLRLAKRGRWRRRIVVAALLFCGAAGGALWWAWPNWFGPLARGRRAYDRSDLASALIEARRAVKESPNDPDSLRLLARASARSGQFDVSDGIYERLGPIGMGPEDFCVVGLVLLREGRRDQAKIAFEMAFKKDSNHPETIHELSRIQGDMDRVYEASDLAQKLSTMPKWEVRGSIMLGMLLGRRADPIGSAAAYTRALKLDPALRGIPNADAIRRELARAQLALAQPAEARRTLERLFTARPDPEAAWLLSRALLQQGDLSGASAALAKADGFGDLDPTAPEPAPYVGTARCADCHAETHRAQRGSRHARTFRAIQKLEDLKAPAGPIADKGDPSVKHGFHSAGDHAEMTTQTDKATYRAVIDYVFGSGDRGLTPVGRDDAGQSRELRLSYYGDTSNWDITAGHPRVPGDAKELLGQPLTRDAVFRCLDCHTTDVRSVRDHVGRATSEVGFGCERCHGPGGNHIQSIAQKFQDPAIARPTLASPEQITRLCGRCHSPRNQDPSPEEPTSVRFQATTLPWSRCYTESRSLSCVSCHDPHRDAATDPGSYEARCLSCHSPKAPARMSRIAELPTGVRRTPCPVNPTKDCVRCHMPVVKDAVPHASFTDHFIRVHRELKTNP
jgi:tetratricopeptide (TPR) repeat protein